MEKIALNDIDFYAKGETLKKDVLNRPVDQLLTNISNQKGVLDKLVDMINTFEKGISEPLEYTADGDKTDFDCNFYKKSIGVYLDGILVDTAKYELNYSDNRNVYGTSITFDTAPDDNVLVKLVPIDVIKMWAGGTTTPIDYIGDDNKDTFEVEFYKSSITVYMDGLLLSSDEYTLNYKDDDGIHGISITFSDTPVKNAWIKIITVA